MNHDEHAKKHHGMIMTMFRHDHGSHVFLTRVEMIIR